MPLLLPDSLLGFIVLEKPHAPHRLTWEDTDLLRIVGKQVAGFLAQDMAAQSLLEARQFQAYNRLTTFIMHDLKNLIAQQSLVVKNAAKYKHDPKFVEDAIATIDNSVQRMNRLLSELNRGESEGSASRVELNRLLRQVVESCGHRLPKASFETDIDDLHVMARENRLATIVGHLIRNAQEATPKDGKVVVRLCMGEGNAVVEIKDTGEGMDAAFVRERLFKPFDTTKGSKGMGIGVYQAREVVRMTGGELLVASTPGEGTCIRIVLPISIPDTPRTDEKQAGTGG